MRYKRPLLQLSLHRSLNTVIANQPAGWPIRIPFSWKRCRASLSIPTLRPSRIIFPSGKLKPTKDAVDKERSGYVASGRKQPTRLVHNVKLPKQGAGHTCTAPRVLPCFPAGKTYLKRAAGGVVINHSPSFLLRPQGESTAKSW